MLQTTRVGPDSGASMTNNTPHALLDACAAPDLDHSPILAYDTKPRTCFMSCACLSRHELAIHTTFCQCWGLYSR